PSTSKSSASRPARLPTPIIPTARNGSSTTSSPAPASCVMPTARPPSNLATPSSSSPASLINSSTITPQDLVIYVIADNPIGESCHYPDSNKWAVRSPERRLIRSTSLDYYDGEE